jgi:hypothetical protein
MIIHLAIDFIRRGICDVGEERGGEELFVLFKRVCQQS